MRQLVQIWLIRLVSILMLAFVMPQPLFCQKDAGTLVAPEYPVWLYQKRMESLNQQSPILLEYNDNVRAYIDVYMVRQRDHFQEILDRSKFYFPLFEEYLDKYNLPLELKYLAIVESALDPKAKSRSGAMGLWQFMLNSGKMFDLNVTSFTDDRCDVRKSTEAACKYLQYLYNTFGDWQLALAAYNGGAGELQKAIDKSKGKRNYWELRPFLTEQMRGYVPAFIAVAYCMNNYNKHGFGIRALPIDYEQVDSVYLQKSSSLSKIASVLKIEVGLLTSLNPIFTKDFIPVSDAPTLLLLPKNSVNSFITSEQLLYADISKNLIYKLAVNGGLGSDSKRVKQYHTVADGEYFHKIAMTYNCRIDEIMSWNKMKSRTLFAGQKLVVWQYVSAPNKYFFAVNEIDNRGYIPLTGSVKLLEKGQAMAQLNINQQASEPIIK